MLISQYQFVFIFFKIFRNQVNLFPINSKKQLGDPLTLSGHNNSTQNQINTKIKTDLL